MNSEVRSIETRGFDSDYWLCRCEGFRVDAGERRLGVVESVRFLSRLERPDTLVVRVGLLRRRLIVPVAEVTKIIPGEARIVIASTPRAMRGKLVLGLHSRLGAALRAGAAALEHGLAVLRAWGTAANR